MKPPCTLDHWILEWHATNGASLAELSAMDSLDLWQMLKLHMLQHNVRTGYAAERATELMVDKT